MIHIDPSFIDAFRVEETPEERAQSELDMERAKLRNDIKLIRFGFLLVIALLIKLVFFP